MDQRTIETYEHRRDEWIAARSPAAIEQARALGRRIEPGAWRADLGCGPGWYATSLGTPVVTIDATQAMLDVVPQYAPGAFRVRADLEALPLRRGALGGAWASSSYVHIAAERVPLALADLHRASSVGAPFEMTVVASRDDQVRDSFGGRFFSSWRADRLRDVVEGAGFTVADVIDEEWALRVRATRARTLPDYVGANMHVLFVGLNPSVYAADAGVGFARPGNRFWPAALAAGVLKHDRDPFAALRDDGAGFTDLVKRATARADELHRDEYRAGAARVERLIEWLAPRAVCVVGFAGWRAAVDRRAQEGWQPRPFGGRPVYVMPNTSGLNARIPLEAFVRHLRSVFGAVPGG